ncbi:MAG TPA: hypothetical protein VGK94_15660 [Candidatus Polarisedimenticolia bacterium]
MTEEVTIMFTLIAMFSAIGWVVWTLASATKSRHMVRAMTEFHNRLLDKIGSAKDFSDFLQSEGGERFLKSVSLDKVNPNERILSAIQTGLVLAFLGIGLLFLGWEFEFDQHAFTVMGTVALAVGGGFLVSSIISHRLSKAWGLLNGREAKPSDR